MRSEATKALTESLDLAFKFLRYAGVVVLAAILLSGVTIVRPDEEAVVLRFGRLVGETPADQVHRPGILIAWPYLIDNVIRVPVKRVQELEIRDYAGTAAISDVQLGESADRGGTTLDPTKVGYVVTGNQNIVHTDVLLKYQVKDPIAYALHIDEPDKVMRTIVLTALTSSVATASVDDALAEGKKRIATLAATDIQQRLDDIGAGISVVSLEFREIVPPQSVARDFEAVTSAYVERQTRIQNAQTYRERELPKAQAERNQLISEARAYAEETLAVSRGEAQAFTQLIAEYRKSPQVVRERLYRETVETALDNVGGRTLMPRSGRGGSVLIPSSPAPSTTEAQQVPPPMEEPPPPTD